MHIQIVRAILFTGEESLLSSRALLLRCSLQRHDLVQRGQPGGQNRGGRHHGGGGGGGGGGGDRGGGGFGTSASFNPMPGLGGGGFGSGFTGGFWSSDKNAPTPME